VILSNQLRKKIEKTLSGFSFICQFQIRIVSQLLHQPFFLQDAKLKKIRRVNKVRNPIKHLCSWPDRKKMWEQWHSITNPLLSLSVNYLVFLSSSPFPVQLKLIKKTDLFRKAPLSLGHFGWTFPALHSSHESKTSRSHRPALPFGYSQKGTDASHPISTKIRKLIATTSKTEKKRRERPLSWN